MIGPFVFRTLALVLGYAYPAYECFKIVELNRPDIEQLNFWCQYWILVAVLTVLERVGDTFISWLPMYNEAKVAFFVYLWHPKTRGATYVYETFFSPYIASNETEIDRILLELKTRAGDFAILYWKKAASYVQTRTFEILQFVASQAPSQESRRQPTQPCNLVSSFKNLKLRNLRSPLLQQQAPPGHQTPLVTQDSKTAVVPSSSQTNRAPAIPTTKANHEPAKDRSSPPVPTPSQAESPSYSNTKLTVSKGRSPPPVPTPSQAESPSSSNTKLTVSSPPSISGEADQVDVGAVITASTGKNSASSSETHFEEGVRITRARLRRQNADLGPSPR